MSIWLLIASICAAGCAVVGLGPLRRDLRSLRAFRPSRQALAAESAFREPLRPLSVVALGPGLTGVQYPIFAVTMAAVPMTYLMRMHGATMVMVMSPPLPVLPLCAAAGLVGGLILALLQRRIRVVAAILAALARVPCSISRSVMFSTRLCPTAAPMAFAGARALLSASSGVVASFAVTLGAPPPGNDPSHAIVAWRHAKVYRVVAMQAQAPP